MSSTPSRPILRYMGGKYRLAPWIVRHFPGHRFYLEPFGGAASVLLHKAPAWAEIYNDLDSEVVGLFRILRDRKKAAEFKRLVELTPFSRCEFEEAYEHTDDPLERARRLVVRSFMGFGSTSVALRRRTGFRINGNRQSGGHPIRDWATWPAAIDFFVNRLKDVGLENLPALELMEKFDRPDCLIFLDPPYLHETRSKKRVGGELEHAYKFEMDVAGHAELLAWCRSSKCMIIISGYPSKLYDDALKGWRRIETKALADGAKPRTEVLWINPAACAAHGLFGAAA